MTQSNRIIPAHTEKSVMAMKTPAALCAVMNGALDMQQHFRRSNLQAPGACATGATGMRHRILALCFT